MSKEDKMLIVDDELVVRRSLQILFEDEYSLSIYDNGEEAVKSVQGNPMDVALVDIELPGMNGIEVLKKLKEIDSDTEVIIITGHASLDTSIEAMKYGASGYIKKPLKPRELQGTIAKALEKRKRRLEGKKKLEET